MVLSMLSDSNVWDRRADEFRTPRWMRTLEDLDDIRNNTHTFPDPEDLCKVEDLDDVLK